MIFSAFWSLFLVVLLICVFVGILKFLQQGRLRFTPQSGKRLKLVETLYLDPKHRLILLNQDDQERLILLGPHTCQMMDVSSKATIEVVNE